MGTEAAEMEFTGLLRGKFIDSSSTEDWWVWMDSSKVNIASYVDPVSKEFEIDISNLKKISFEGSKAIEHIYELPVSANVTSLSRAFYECSYLRSIKTNGKNSVSLTSLADMFRGCESLATVDFTYLNTENVTTFAWMFYRTGVTELIFNFIINETASSDFIGAGIRNESKNIKSTGGLLICNNIDFSLWRNLTDESIQTLINGLEDRSDKSSKTISLYVNCYNKLTDEQKEIANQKNWNIKSI